MRGPRPLCEVLAYRNIQVVQAFRARFDVTPAEARELFTETCRWLWLCARWRAEHRGARRPIPLAIDGALRMLDEMWHTFLLFTRDYARFCEAYLGGFLHHVPTPPDAKARYRRRAAQQPARARQAELRRLTRQCAFVHAHLGQETLSKWYEEFPRRYPPDVITRLALPWT